jgi:hypothetical protein
MPGKFTAILCAFAIVLASPAQAKINVVKPNMLFEGSDFRVGGLNFNSADNPLIVSFIDGEGNQFGEAAEVKSKTKTGFKVTAPNVSNTKTLLIKISGGDTSEEKAETFPVVIFDVPDPSSPSPGPPGADGQIDATTVTTNSIIIKDNTLGSDSDGNLSWNNNAFLSKEGILVTDRVTLGGIAITSDTNQNLVWNSHIIAKADGGLSAANLVNGTTSLAIKGTQAISLDTQGKAINLKLPASGTLVSSLVGDYDFAVDGGVTGAIKLRNITLPKNAVVTRAWYEVLTTFTSASDQSAISIGFTGSTSALLNSIAINDVTNPWDQGWHGCKQLGTAATFSAEATADAELLLTVTGEALTAGKLRLHVEYLLSP